MGSKLRKVVLEIVTSLPEEDLHTQLEAVTGRHLPGTDIQVWSATLQPTPKLDPTRATSLAPPQRSPRAASQVREGYDEEDEL